MFVMQRVARATSFSLIAWWWGCSGICTPIAPARAGDAERPDAGRTEWGFVDVTAAPWSADPTGARDSTRAIQQAINVARDSQRVCFFPPGRYLVSDTLRCEQFRPMRDEGRRRGTREYPCVLVGSRQGNGRPTIVLAANSPGFGDPEHRKYVVHFFSMGMGTETPIDQLQPNISMNQMLTGINIELGHGNAGAVAIRHRAAQGSGVQDCRIDATYGYCGLEGGAGSGGSHTNVTIVGGRIGVDLSETQPAPTLTGFTLLNQSETALVCSSRQALCAVGLKITMRTKGPAIVSRKKWGAHHGQLCLIDSEIHFPPNTQGRLIDTQSSVYLHNVFVRGADQLVRIEGRRSIPSLGAEWTVIRKLAVGVAGQFRARTYHNLTFTYPAPVYVDGKRLAETVLVDLEAGEPPPKDLQSRHLWQDSFPSWESPGAVNVREAPYRAAGDGTTDDSAAIQRAIDEHDIVFLPKGRYVVSRTLRLRPNTKLVGLHRCYSWLIPVDRENGDFHDPDHPRPVVQTANDARAATVLAFLGIRTLEDSTAAYCLHWQCGRPSIFRGVNTVFSLRAPPQGRATERVARSVGPISEVPTVLIDGHGGGRWYNFHQESSRGHGALYRHLLVLGTTEPLDLYQCNPEHARSDANMELRAARDVSIYGLTVPKMVIRTANNR